MQPKVRTIEFPFILWLEETGQQATVVSVVQLCPTLCDPIGCSPPGAFVHGISQARILQWVAIASSRASPQPRDQTRISGIGRQLLYHQSTRETASVRVRFKSLSATYVAGEGPLASSLSFRPRWLGGRERVMCVECPEHRWAFSNSLTQDTRLLYSCDNQ